MQASTWTSHLFLELLSEPGRHKGSEEKCEVTGRYIHECHLDTGFSLGETLNAGAKYSTHWNAFTGEDLK